MSDLHTSIFLRFIPEALQKKNTLMETIPYFFWLVPDSSKTGVVGVSIDDGEGTQQALDGFIRI